MIPSTVALISQCKVQFIPKRFVITRFLRPFYEPGDRTAAGHVLSINLYFRLCVGNRWHAHALPGPRIVMPSREHSRIKFYDNEPQLRVNLPCGITGSRALTDDFRSCPTGSLWFHPRTELDRFWKISLRTRGMNPGWFGHSHATCKRKSLARFLRDGLRDRSQRSGHEKSSEIAARLLIPPSCWVTRHQHFLKHLRSSPRSAPFDKRTRVLI